MATDVYRKFQDAVFGMRPVFAAAELEVTTRCSAACTYCPRTARARPPGDASRETIEAITERLAREPPLAVLLSGFGEPTQHPDLAALVRILQGGVPAPVGLVTNAERLTPELSQRLVDAGVGFFHVSVPSASETVAGMVAPGLDFAAAQRNLHELLTLVRDRIPVAVNFVVTPANRHEKAAVCRTWRSRGVRAVYCARRHSRGGFLHQPKAVPVRSDCWLYHHNVFASWDGSVLACCHDLSGAPCFGDLAHEGVAEIRRRKAACAAEVLSGPMCRSCDFFLAGAAQHE